MSGDQEVPPFPWGRGQVFFAALTNNDVAELLRDLKEAETIEDWNAVLARMVFQFKHYEARANRIYEHWPRQERLAWESKCAELSQLVTRGFRPPPHRPRLTARAHHDAYVIRTWAGAKTVAEAVAFLRKAYLLSETEARSRVRLASSIGGITLAPAPRGGTRARKQPPSK